jgi:hypothetical protein
MSKLQTAALLALGATLGLVGARGCGGVSSPSDPRVAARDQATKKTCDKYMSCGLIGADAGTTYQTYDSCTTTWEGNWENQWSIAMCEGKIDQTNLATCIDRIGGTDCTSLLDVLNTLLNTCSAAKVCDVGGDAGTD